MLAYAAGHAASFDTLYARHKGGTYRYILRHIRDAAAADELFQDVWMNAIRVRASYVPTAKFTTWIYTLAHNKVVDHWRSKGQAQFASIDNDEDGEARALVESIPGSELDEPERRASAAELGTHLKAALDALPAEQRDAFLMQYEGGLSLADIAASHRRGPGDGEEPPALRHREITQRAAPIARHLAAHDHRIQPPRRPRRRRAACSVARVVARVAAARARRRDPRCRASRRGQRTAQGERRGAASAEVVAAVRRCGGDRRGGGERGAAGAA